MLIYIILLYFNY